VGYVDANNHRFTIGDQIVSHGLHDLVAAAELEVDLESLVAQVLVLAASLGKLLADAANCLDTIFDIAEILDAVV